MSARAPARSDRTTRAAMGNGLDYLFALRPLLWIPAIALFEAGRADGGGSWWPPARALPGLASLLAILGVVHLVNGWNDRAGDRINRKGGALAAGVLSGRGLVVVGASGLLVSLAAASSPVVTTLVRMALVAALGLGAAYAVPPFEWKRRPGLDLLAQAAGYGLVAFLLGSESSPSAGRPPLAMLAASAPYALGIAAVGLVTMLADRAGDEAVGQRTTAVALGRRRALNVALGLAVGTSAAGLAVGAWAPGLWGLLALAALALFAPSIAPSQSERASRGDDRERWNRIAIVLQLAFVLLLLPRTPIPLLAAFGIGVVASWHDRRIGGRGYPWSAGERTAGEAEPVEAGSG